MRLHPCSPTVKPLCQESDKNIVTVQQLQLPQNFSLFFRSLTRSPQLASIPPSNLPPVMAPKRSAASTPQPSAPSSTPSRQPTKASVSSSTTTTAPKSSQSAVPKSTSTPISTQSAQDILLQIWNNYLEKTPQRVKLIDVFMAFLVVVGGVQFVYCVLAGNYVSSRLFCLRIHNSEERVLQKHRCQGGGLRERICPAQGRVLS